MIGITERWTPYDEQGIERPYPTGKRGELMNDLFTLDELGNSALSTFVVPCGRQSLKTEISAKRNLAWRFIQSAKFWYKRKRKDYRLIYAAPTQDQAKRLVWEDFKKLIPSKHYDRRYGGKINETELSIKSCWGAELRVIGLDRPARAEGDGVDGIVMDERSDHKADFFDYHVAPLLIARGGFDVHVGTPDFAGSDAANYRKLSDAAERGEIVNGKHYHWPSSDVIHPDIIAAKKLRMNDLAFRQEYIGLWVDAPGRAFWEFVESDHKQDTPFIPGLPIMVSCDFNSGYHNWLLFQVEIPGSFVVDGVTILNSESLPVFRFFDQIFNQDCSTGGMIKDLTDRINHYAPAYLTTAGALHFYGDYSGSYNSSYSDITNWKQIEQAFPIAKKSECFHYAPTISINTGLNAVNDALRSAAGLVRIQIDKRCENLLDDFQLCRRLDMFNGSHKQGPRTHAADDARYAVTQFRKDHARKVGEVTVRDTKATGRAFSKMMG